MKFTLLKASFENIILRFALMMALVIGGMFTGMEWLMILALPVFLTALLAVKIEFGKSAASKSSKTHSKIANAV
jgi:hypothetical protein